MHDLLFAVLSFTPGPFWLILIVAPGVQFAWRCLDVYLLLLSAVFSVQTLPVVQELLPTIASPTLPAIQHLLGSRSGTLAAWNHMILADLWIGRWVCQDAIRHAMPAMVRTAALVVVLFFGPLGLFLYCSYRTFHTGSLWTSDRATRRASNVVRGARGE